jgi:hypothetical protein
MTKVEPENVTPEPVNENNTTTPPDKKPEGGCLSGVGLIIAIICIIGGIIGFVSTCS